MEVLKHARLTGAALGARRAGLAASLLAVAALAACGGGGSGAATGNLGGGAEPTQNGDHVVTFTPSRVDLITIAGRSTQFSVKAAVSGPDESGPLYAALLVDKPVLEQSSVAFSVDSDDNVVFRPLTDRNLAPGRYDTTVMLRVCRNVQCSSEISLSGGTFPLTVTVVPRLQVTVQGAEAKSDRDYQIAAGTRFVLTSNTDVNWTKTAALGGPDFQVIASSPTRLEAMFQSSSSGLMGIDASSVATPTDPAQPPNRVSLIFMVTASR